MLKNELALLAEWTNDSELSASKLSGDEEGRVATECRRIKKAWTDLLFSQAKDHVIKRYVRFQQQMVLELADQVYRQLEVTGQELQGDNASMPQTRLVLLNCLLDLKDFQVQYMNSFFYEGGKIPDAAMPGVRQKLSYAAEHLSASLEIIEIDLGLKACIRDYLSSVTSMDAAFPLTYRTSEYVLSFTETLEVTISFEDNRDMTHVVTEVLFYMNFNQNNFCQWYEEAVISKKQLIRQPDQPSWLMKQLLTLKSMPVSLTIAYDLNIPAVNLQVENWLNEYIKQETFQFDFEVEQIDKLELKLTVAQMALLIRLLYDEGVFAMKNIAAILRFFSAHYMSKKQEHISYGSMNKLYYSGDQFAASAVRDLLLKMITRINKMFFPN
jgi:hypothetical protein